MRTQYQVKSIGDSLTIVSMFFLKIIQVNNVRNVLCVSKSKRALNFFLKIKVFDLESVRIEKQLTGKNQT